MDEAVASHFGGTRNGLVVHWPKGISDRGGVRTQWHHVIDVAPTILEAAGIPHPDRVDGIAQRPIEGTSMLYACATAPRRTGTSPVLRDLRQPRDLPRRLDRGHQAPFSVGPVANRPHPVRPGHVELYDITRDFSQATDLASEYPERLAALQGCSWSRHGYTRCCRSTTEASNAWTRRRRAPRPRPGRAGHRAGRHTATTDRRIPQHIEHVVSAERARSGRQCRVRRRSGELGNSFNGRPSTSGKGW